MVNRCSQNRVKKMAESKEHMDAMEKALKEIVKGKLDEIDIKIYKLLRDDGRLSDTELAEKLGVSVTTARRRRIELQKKGYLQIVGLLYFGPAEIAYADVIVKVNLQVSVEDVIKFIKECANTPYIYEITEYMGNYILLRFYENDLERLNYRIHRFLHQRTVVEDYKIYIATWTPKAWNKTLWFRFNESNKNK